MLQRYLIKFDYGDNLIRTTPFTILIKKFTTARMIYNEMIKHIYIYVRKSPNIKKSNINIVNVIKL